MHPKVQISLPVSADSCIILLNLHLDVYTLIGNSVTRSDLSSKANNSGPRARNVAKPAGKNQSMVGNPYLPIGGYESQSRSFLCQTDTKKKFEKKMHLMHFCATFLRLLCSIASAQNNLGLYKSALVVWLNFYTFV